MRSSKTTSTCECLACRRRSRFPQRSKLSRHKKRFWKTFCHRLKILGRNYSRSMMSTVSWKKSWSMICKNWRNLNKQLKIRSIWSTTSTSASQFTRRNTNKRWSDLTIGLTNFTRRSTMFWEWKEPIRKLWGERCLTWRNELKPERIATWSKTNSSRSWGELSSKTYRIR